MAAGGALVPALFWFELRNILVVNERRKRIQESATRSFLRDLALLPIRMEAIPDEESVMRLARAHSLTVYDAAYLELAARSEVSLATLDRSLSLAASAEGVPLL